MMNSLTELKTVLFFIGSHRTGSSIIKCIIDAHENCMISHERARTGIYSDLLASKITKQYVIKQFCLHSGWNTSPRILDNGKESYYDNHIENSYQGTCKKMEIVGDKGSPWTACLFLNDPTIHTKLETIFGVDVKYIHTIRNPFDVIDILDKDDIEHSTNLFIRNCKGTEIAKCVVCDKILDIYIEDFQKNPSTNIKRIFSFLNQPVTDEFVNNCLKIIKKKNPRRFLRKWTKEQKDKIQNIIDTYPWLSKYTFEELK